MDKTSLDKMKELYGIRAADDVVAIFQLYKIRKEKGWDRRTFVRESNIDICNYDNIENFRFTELYEKNDNLWRRVVLRLILEELKANEEY